MESFVVTAKAYPVSDRPVLADGDCKIWGLGRLVLVYKVRMPDGVPERTDGVNIYIDDRLNEIQEKCAIAHAMVHIEWGHSTLQTEDVEMAVRYETAKRLLPLDVIAGVCKDGRTLKQIARDLGVTRGVLMDRAATLTDTQAVSAGCMSCLKCPVMAARFAGHPVGTLLMELAGLTNKKRPPSQKARGYFFGQIHVNAVNKCRPTE